MEQTLKVLKELEENGVIQKYAIGGGMALMFYTEPLLTYDLDIFVLLPTTETKLMTLSPVYAYLRRKGYKAHHEHVMIEGVPVQLIPAYNLLVEEGLADAREMRYKKTTTRVLRAEHLLAIMLQTDRPKDRTRMIHLLEQANMNLTYLRRILQRHGLWEKWRAFKRRFNES
jgi:hypothetical protein